MGIILYSLGFLLVLKAKYRAPHYVTAVPRILGQIVEGLRYIRTNPKIKGTLFITIAMNVFGFPYVAMVPVIGDQILDQGAVATGILVSAEATGALVGALLIANFVRPRNFASVFFYLSLIHI